MKRIQGLLERVADSKADPIRALDARKLLRIKQMIVSTETPKRKR